MCTSLYKADRDEPWDGNPSRTLAGSLVSSLHRLKDTDNKDGGFFVFGDISVKVQGTFRLHFSLFELRKDQDEVMYLGSITSDPFKVLLPKDFKGMEESTYLSRAFSDQGVRLRLRKEPRAMIKRPYPYGIDAPASNAAIRPSMHDYASYEDSSSSNKRHRVDDDDDDEIKREPYTDHPGFSSGHSYTPGYTSSQYPVRHPSLPSAYGSMSAPYPPYSALSTGGTSSSYTFQPVNLKTGNYFGDSALPTSGTGFSSSSMAPESRYSNINPQPLTDMYTFGQNRNTTSTALGFSDDTSGIGGYTRTAANMGTEETRPATASGIPNSMSITQHTPQSQQSGHLSHSSISSSGGASYTHSPELMRHGGFPDQNFTDRYLAFSSPLPPHRTLGRIDDHSHMTSGLPVLSNQRNPLPAPPSESNLTSHTDGTLRTSLHYTPDLGQSTEDHPEHVADNR
jgi:hypothetical protein